MDDAGSQQLLMNITKEYPWFTPAHFFLLKKTRDTEPGYDKMAAKTALHFDNPFLLNYRLKVEKEVEEVEKVDKPEHIVKEDMKVEKIEEEVKNVEETKTEVNNDEMIFEPLFASDYFASQGIKLSEEVQTADKLGKQLKSFTEWLKSMKKIHETKASAETVQIDLAVQNLAEKSNQEEDILTESMAEAYLQQGKLKKARETFEKLSFPCCK